MRIWKTVVELVTNYLLEMNYIWMDLYLMLVVLINETWSWKVALGNYCKNNLQPIAIHTEEVIGKFT